MKNFILGLGCGMAAGQCLQAIVGEKSIWWGILCAIGIGVCVHWWGDNARKQVSTTEWRDRMRQRGLGTKRNGQSDR